jgi:hypothetical protein
MKKLLILALLLSLAAAAALAHAGHVHTYMGTVTAIHGDEFILKTTDGKEVTVHASPQTAWTTADGHAASKSDLTAGARVAVKMNTDGKTAASVKMSAPRKKE